MLSKEDQKYLDEQLAYIDEHFSEQDAKFNTVDEWFAYFDQQLIELKEKNKKYKEETDALVLKIFKHINKGSGDVKEWLAQQDNRIGSYMAVTTIMKVASKTRNSQFD
jgi:ribosome assembly protein YihI (activator of Der GTPase)